MAGGKHNVAWDKLNWGEEEDASPALQMQVSHAMWLAEVYRVLAPGGVIKAFSGSRTQHRLGAAMEAAGFVDVGIEAWTYSCLSADTEILTESGWKLGVNVVEGERVACWDPATGQVKLDVVQEIFRGPFQGDLVSLRNANTDQALTPNHRVWKKHRIRKMVGKVRETSEEAEWCTQEAGTINKWNNLRLPLAGTHDGPGIGGADIAELLGWVWAEGGFDDTGTGVRIYQSSVNQAFVDAIQVLMDKVAPGHSHYMYEREHQSRNPERGLYKYMAHTWYFSGKFALQVRGLLTDKHLSWPLVWGMTQEEKQAFLWAAIRGDGQIKTGETRWVGDGRYPNTHCIYQKSEPDLVLLQALLHLTDRRGQINFKGSCIGIWKGGTTQLQRVHFKKLSPLPYDGEVWCVRVPTSAFMARRNGLVFITGNSGFPKSHHVGKGVDRSLGLERKIVGYKRGVRGADGTGHEKAMPGKATGVKQVACDVPVTAPASPQAALWEEWGTALKPAWEPVLVGRKPIR